jgi:hypothetical protein
LRAAPARRRRRQAPLLARAVSDHNVRAAAFSPFEPDAFLTAGRDSIRRCRLAPGGRVRGVSVRRGPGGPGNAPAPGGTAAPGSAEGPNVFTAVAFEAGAAARQAGRRNVFVASAAGTVLQVDYDGWARAAAAGPSGAGGVLDRLFWGAVVVRFGARGGTALARGQLPDLPWWLT